MTKAVTVKPDGTRVRLDTVWGQHWLSVKEAMRLREDLDLALTQSQRSVMYHAARALTPGPIVNAGADPFDVPLEIVPTGKPNRKVTNVRRNAIATVVAEAQRLDLP